MAIPFGTLPDGQKACLYTISSGDIQAVFTDLGATLVSLSICGTDVVLGYDNAESYFRNPGLLGTTVGRNANRIKHAQFSLGGTLYHLPANSGPNNIHSGPDRYSLRLWDVAEFSENTIVFHLFSPHMDQGFPGNMDIRVTYAMEAQSLCIRYDMLSDRDTVCNFTNHSYFNLYGHHRPECAIHQRLQVHAREVSATDENNLPTGSMRAVDHSVLDFRQEAPLSRGLMPLHPDLSRQKGYDHNYALLQPEAAALRNPESGLTMKVCTDCPGLQVYTANYLNVSGKNGVAYGPHSAVCLETQFFPDSVNHPQWKQPFLPANVPYHSETRYQFSFHKE